MTAGVGVVLLYVLAAPSGQGRPGECCVVPDCNRASRRVCGGFKASARDGWDGGGHMLTVPSHSPRLVSGVILTPSAGLGSH